MRLRPRDPAKELRQAEHALADAEQDLREMNMRYSTRASKRLAKQTEVAELKAKIERLRQVVP